MSTKHKTSAAHFGMTFLLLSLTIVPVSMRAAGFSPRLTAIVDAWNQIAGVFGDGHQPVAATELLALNQPETDHTPFPAQENTCQQGLLAFSEQPAVDRTEFSQVIAYGPECNQSPKSCAKSARRPAPRPRVEVLSERQAKASGNDMRIVAFDIQQASKRLESLREIESLKALKEFPSREVDLAGIMKSLPAPKEIKLLLKAKAFVPTVTRCSTSSVKNSEIEEQFRRWAVRTRSASAAVTVPENSEL